MSNIRNKLRISHSVSLPKVQIYFQNTTNIFTKLTRKDYSLLYETNLFQTKMFHIFASLNEHPYEYSLCFRKNRQVGELYR